MTRLERIQKAREMANVRANKDFTITINGTIFKYQPKSIFTPKIHVYFLIDGKETHSNTYNYDEDLTEAEFITECQRIERGIN